MYFVIIHRNDGCVSKYVTKFESDYWNLYTWFTNKGYKVEVYKNNELILGR